MNQMARKMTEALCERAAEAPAFRTWLLASPREAVESLLGRSLPIGMEVRVLEESAGRLVLVLPPAGTPARGLAAGEPGLRGGWANDDDPFFDHLLPGC
jgi:hypothetical protein